MPNPWDVVRRTEHLEDAVLWLLRRPRLARDGRWTTTRVVATVTVVRHGPPAEIGLRAFITARGHTEAAVKRLVRSGVVARRPKWPHELTLRL